MKPLFADEDGCNDEDASKFKKRVDELVEATTNKLNEPRGNAEVLRSR